MMFERELERKIQDFRELGLPPYCPRKGKILLVENMISIILGARRSGKSYRALQLADELIGNSIIGGLTQVCHVDFDNPILSAMGSADLKLIQSTLLKISPQFGLKTPLIFILDEIHKIRGWEEYVIDLSRNPHWRVIVTGSSSKLLRDNVATALRGKAVSTMLYPLSFDEYLAFKRCTANPSSTKGQAEIQGWFDEYMQWGGYPALTRVERQAREVLLREYFDTMILKDIIQRFNVSKPGHCIQLYRYLLSNIAKPHTLQSAYGFLKQAGHATSRDSIRDYIGWAEDSWLLFNVPIHTHSAKEVERNYRKVYCIDWALAVRNSAVWDGSYSRAFENMIYLHLRRNFPRVCYYLTREKRQEVDFLVSDEHGKAALAVQVCMDISMPDTLRRELEPLVRTAKHFGTKENLIVTMNAERRFDQEGVIVHAVPAWRWLRQ